MEQFQLIALLLFLFYSFSYSQVGQNLMFLFVFINRSTQKHILVLASSTIQLTLVLSHNQMETTQQYFLLIVHSNQTGTKDSKITEFGAFPSNAISVQMEINLLQAHPTGVFTCTIITLLNLYKNSRHSSNLVQMLLSILQYPI